MLTDAPPDVDPDPIVELPATTGPYAVGTRILHLFDADRLETVTEDPDDVREILVQLYYPTDASGPAAPLMTEDEAEAVYDGAWPTAHLDVLTHSTFDVPISTDRETWPVIFYSHGLGGPRHDNRALFEALASEGYVVVAVDHTWYEWGATLSTGVVTDFEGYALTTRDERFDIWVADDRFVVRSLGELAADTDCPLLRDRLDLDGFGVFGWSTGGAVALSVCALEENCAGAASLDGLFGDQSVPSHAPILMVGGLPDSATNATAWSRLAERAESTASGAWIDGLGHFGFSSFVVAGVKAGWSFGTCDKPDFDCGTIDPDRGYDLYSAYVAEFFGNVVRGDDAPLFDAAPGVQADAQEVLFERSDGTGALRAFGSATAALTAGTPVPEARVSATEGAVATVSENGRWVVEALQPGTRLGVRIEADGYMPLLATLAVEDRSVGLLTPLVTDQLVQLVAGSCGASPEQGTGSVLISVNALWESPEGLTLTGDAAPCYLATTGLGDVTLTAMGEAGSAVFTNLEPGTWAFTLEHPSLTCTAPTAPTAAGGGFEVEVEADALTYVPILCER